MNKINKTKISFCYRKGEDMSYKSIIVDEDISFKNYEIEKIYIESIFSRLLPEENRIREWLMDYVLENGTLLNVLNMKQEDLIKLNLDLATFEKRIDALKEKRAIVKDEDGNINFIYPVSALPTKHRVTLKDGRSFYAMCAVDAMGAAFTFKQDIKIKSECSECGEKIELEIVDGRIVKLVPNDAYVLHVDLNKNDNWSGSC